MEDLQLPAALHQGLRHHLFRAVCLCIALLATVCQAGDGNKKNWPHPRGPGLDGVSLWQDLALPFPASGPPMLWQRGIGMGYSGAVVSGDRLVTQVQTQAGESVICLNLHTGELLWQTVYSPPDTITEVYPGPYATPSCTDKRIYVSGSTGSVLCLDLEDGAIIWRLKLPAKGARIPGFGYAVTPLLHDGKVFLPAGGEGTSMFALDADDGSVVWQAGDEGATYASAIVVKMKGNDQVVGFYEHSTIGFDPDTGKQLWHDALSANYNPQAAWPVFQEPFLLRAQTFRRGARLLHLDHADGITKVGLQWQNKSMSNDVVSTVIVGDHIYGFDSHEDQPRIDGHAKGEFKCIELLTGKERWRTDRTGLSSVIACGSKLLLVNERGELIVLEATPNEYRELARAQLTENELCWSPPALAGGYLIIRGSRRISCFYLGDPDAVADRVGVLDRVSQSARFWRRWTFGSDRASSFSQPGIGQFALWYAACLVIAIGVWGAAAACRRKAILNQAVFVAAGAVGFVALPLFAKFAGQLVFTWPLTVWCCFVVVMTIWLQAIEKPTTRSRWCARAAMLGFVALAGAYMGLCRFLEIRAGYGFLTGVPAAWVVHRLLSGKKSAPWRLAVAGLGFTAYFWVSALFILWRMG